MRLQDMKIDAAYLDTITTSQVAGLAERLREDLLAGARLQTDEARRRTDLLRWRCAKCGHVERGQNESELRGRAQDHHAIEHDRN